MVTPQSVQGHSGLTYHFLIPDIRALWRSGLSAREPECQKLKNGGLDQYGPERFGRVILLQSEKCGTERVKQQQYGAIRAYCTQTGVMAVDRQSTVPSLSSSHQTLD